MGRKLTKSSLATAYAFRLACLAGISEKLLCKQTGLDLDELYNPDTRIPYEKQNRLLEEAARLSGNEYFWLGEQEPVELSKSNATFYYYYNAPDLKEASARFEKIYRILSDVAYPSHFVQGDEFIMRMALRGEDMFVTKYYVDWCMSQWMGTLLNFAGPEARIKAVRLETTDEERLAAYSRFFQVPIEGGYDHNELVYDQHVFNLPNRRQDIDPNLDRILEKLLLPAMKSLDLRKHFTEEIFQAIQSLLPHGAPAIGAIARQMGMSQRTLQRKLSLSNMSFRGIVMETRKTLAQSYLLDNELNINEVALLLGYSETSSLTSSFKKWFGMSPREYREKYRI
ncbi:MAG: AraC family transcriptional regulator [Deltaproteobacteria bacterium]|nr:AraC family transcriptional regulator [Deltaproteobacteria bacterium]